MLEETLPNLYDILTDTERALPPFEKIVSFLTQHAASFRIIEHEPEGQSDKIAKIRGNEPQQGAKAILTISTRSNSSPYTLVVVPANEGLDFGKLKKLIGVKNTTMAPIEDMERLTNCVRGSVPPFSFWPEISLLVDEGLIRRNTEIVFNAGRLDRSIFLNVRDYVRICKPRLVNVVKSLVAQRLNGVSL
jgi:Ala-tRNA(Pro) deacylase